MKKQSQPLIRVVPILLFLLAGPTLAANDFALRPELDMAGPVGTSLGWGWKLETVIDTHVQRASALNLLARVSWQPVAGLKVTPELYYGTKGGDPEGREWRPRLDVETGKKLGTNTWAVRGRAEYRMKFGQDNYWRYRGRLKIKFPQVIGCKPFIYDEVFYEAGTKNQLNTNEVGIGVGVPFRDGVALVLDLRLITEKRDGQWQDFDVHLLATTEIRF